MSNQNVTTLEDQPSSPVAKVEAPAEMLIKHNDDFCGQRCNLTIHKSNNKEDQSFVFVGVNGTGYQIPRGKPWNVPVEVVNNLENATETSYGRDEDNKPTISESPRFAYTVTPAAPVGRALLALEAAQQAALSKAAAAKAGAAK